MENLNSPVTKEKLISNQKAQDQIASMVNSTEHLQRSNTNSSEILPRNWKGRNTSEPISCEAIITLIPKLDRDTTRKLQTNICDEY